jgi:hypothetical protein
MSSLPQNTTMADHISGHNTGRPDTALDLLQKALGRDASLLQAISMDEIEVVDHSDKLLGSYLNKKILVGTVASDNDTVEELWAYMKGDARLEGLPEVYFIATHPTTKAYTPWTAKEAHAHAKLRDEFQVLATRRAELAAVFKVYPNPILPACANPVTRLSSFLVVSSFRSTLDLRK